MPRSLLALFVVNVAVTLVLAGCVFDVGVDPATPTDASGGGGTIQDTADGAAGAGDIADVSADTGPTDGAAVAGDIADVSADTAAPVGPLPAPGVWPATFTTTLTGDGLTLQPLGARRGFTGVLSAPDGSLRLEALP